MITDAGFTGDDRRSHLLSLGEFFAMYLFVWSDVLWSETIPYADFEKILDATLAAHPTWKVDGSVKSEYDSRENAVQAFRKTLPAVRRALANVPTYMILDDHEVTDDLNMTRHFVEKVYADDLGVRIVQNALTAYAVCQVWGNIPEQFDAATPTAAGTQLLAQLSAIANAADNPGAFEKAVQAIMQLVGVHQRVDMNDGSDGSMHAFHEGTSADTVTVNGVAVNTKSLRYNFTVEGPAHQVLVTDTRSWRGFAVTPRCRPCCTSSSRIRSSMRSRCSESVCRSSSARRTRRRSPPFTPPCTRRDCRRSASRRSIATISTTHGTFRRGRSMS